MMLRKMILLAVLSISGISVNAYSAEYTFLSCEGLALPASAQQFISKGYSDIKISTLGNSKYLYLSSENDVNKCSVVFKVDSNHIENVPTAGEDGKLCNISELNGNVVSFRRDQGRWYNDVYKISPEKSWVLIFTDSCADCQQVKRIYYKNGIKEREELLSEGTNYSTRKPLSGMISIQKAFLYSKPDEQKKMKAYLIKGDVFTLTDMSDDGTFYQVNFKTSVGKNVLYWIKSDDFELK
ncbi:hypothetical protein QFJ66_00460 [Raoultella terrigena]|uniref:hypothetical protein n=1 Tax=Raoultella terrigena TaxID=577 RepID=UPI002F9431DF